jgi:DNA topoisomerase-3
MESAGKDVADDQERDAMKDCGLGTPATRDNIIKTLIYREYITREKKNLLPTTKGLVVYDIVKDLTISSPALTGNWEKRMNDMQAGQISFKQFMDGIRIFTMSIVNELKQVKTDIKSSKDIANENMPVCPKCKKANLHKFSKGIGCNQECGFVVWNTISGKTLTDNQMIELASTGKTTTIKGFLSRKTGKKFDAKLKLDENFKIVFAFENNKK